MNAIYSLLVVLDAVPAPEEEPELFADEDAESGEGLEPSDAAGLSVPLVDSPGAAFALLLPA